MSFATRRASVKPAGQKARPDPRTCLLPQQGAPKILAMRLTQQQRQAVLDAVHAADPAARVWLHGSRVDDSARGGDIDLVVLSRRIGLAEKLDLLGRLHHALGEQKIDLTIAADGNRPFVQLALERGLPL